MTLPQGDGTITQADIRSARLVWRRYAPDRYKDLLDAQPVDDEKNNNLIGLFLILFLAGMYLDIATDDFIPYSVVRGVLDLVIDGQAVAMNTLSQQLIDGTITTAEWQAGMAENIIDLHIDAVVSARGGLEQMTAADWQQVNEAIREQMEYLDNFASQIRDGKQGLNGQVLVRSDMYADAARGTFEETRTGVRQSEGMQEERRYTEEGVEHCDGCLEQAGLQWQPIGTLLPIGDADCLTRCHCTKKYRKLDNNGNWIVFEG